MCLGHWSNNKSRANHQTKEKFSKAKHKPTNAAIMCDDDFSEKKKFFLVYYYY
jgi:hypothetical protein